MIKNAKCARCRQDCFIQCGKCCCILNYFGQKHDCPNDDEGFFDDNEGSVIVCDDCKETLKCICCGMQSSSDLCDICTEIIMNDIDNDEMRMQ